MNKVLDVYLHEIYAGKFMQNESGRLLFFDEIEKVIKQRSEHILHELK